MISRFDMKINGIELGIKVFIPECPPIGAFSNDEEAETWRTRFKTYPVIAEVVDFYPTVLKVFAYNPNSGHLEPTHHRFKTAYVESPECIFDPISE
jgi:hypothetical protein